MKLILGSDYSFLINGGYDLVGIPKEEMKIGYITTAAKGARDKTFFNEIKKRVKSSGYNLIEIDIEGKSKDELRQFFADKDVVHIEGGNTFYLLRAIRESGFDEVLKELLESGKVYVGTSAGAYIMCPTIEVADWNDNGKDRFGVTDFTALDYVPFLFKVHYTDDQEDFVKQRMQRLKYDLKILKDGQGLLVEDGRVTFLGEGSKVKL